MKKSISIICLITLVACGTKKSVNPENVSTTVGNQITKDSLLVSDSLKTPAKRPTYRAAETILTDLIHTKLEVNFNWTNSRMNGIATITAKPHFYASDSLILDAKGMDILSVQLDKKELSFSYLDSLTLKIKLNKTYNRKEKYTVVINYIAKPDERKTSGSSAITSDKGLYFINPKGEDTNKMPQIWTQGETESSSVWFPTIDSPNAKTTQEIFITVEDKFMTLSNGKLVASKKNPNGTRTDHWIQELPHAPYLFMMGIGEFKTVKDSYTRPDGSKMEVNYIVEPEWEKSAKAIFGETPNMIRHFSELLGYEFAWDKYSQIVVRDYVSGAMENTGAVVFGDYAYKTDRELLDGNDQSTIAHELFHHWFGDLVTCESWSNLSLNESFANYSQYLWDEHKFGMDEADFQAELEADGYFQSSQTQGYHNLIWLDYDDKEQMFDGHSYNKGGRILHMLRNYLGDEAFFEGIKNYLQTNKFKPAEFHQLRIAFEEVSGEDLNWFFNQWYLGSGHPLLDVQQKINAEKGTVTVSVKQIQNLELSPIFKLPVQIAVFDANGKTLHNVVVDDLEESFDLPFVGEVKSVVFDYQQMLLSKMRETKPAEQYIFQYYQGERYKARKDGLVFGSKSKTEAGQQLIIDALKDSFWNLRILAIEKAAKLQPEKKQIGLDIIKVLAVTDASSQVRVAALNFLANAMEGQDLEAILMDRLEKDQSYLVISTALKHLGKSNPEKALAAAKNLEVENSSKMVTGIAQLYGAHGGEEKFNYFETVLKSTNLKGFDQLSVMNSLTYYITRQNTEMLDKAFDLYAYLKLQGDFYTQMFLPQNITYLMSMFDTKILELTEEIAAHEKNKDALYADQARKKIKAFEALKIKYAVLEVKE